MADNVTTNTNTTSGAIFACASLSFSGDTAVVQCISPGALSGSEGAWSYTLFVGGAGTVGAGVQRMTLASDDPAVAALQLIDNAVSGAGFNITQLGGASVPIGAGTEAAAVRVTLATDSTGVVSIDDNGGVITVDGTVAVTGMTACNTGAVVLATGTAEIGNVKNAGTFAVQESGAALTALQLIDNCISGSEAQVDIVAALPAGTNLLGKIGIDQVTANGNEVVVKSGTVTTVGTVTTITNSVTVTGTVTANLSATDNAVLDAIALGFATEGDALGDGVLLQGDDGTDRTNVLVDTDGHLQIDVLSCASHAVTNAGTFAVQAACVLGAETTKVIGTVNIASAQTLATVTNLSQLGGANVPIGAGTEAAAIRVTLPTDGTGVVKLGAGTAEIGKLGAGTAMIGSIISQQSSSIVYDGATACTVKRFHSVVDAAGEAVIAAPTGTKKIRVLSMAVFALSATASTFYLESGTTGTDCFGTAAGPLTIEMDGTSGPAGIVLPWNPGGWFQVNEADEALDVVMSSTQAMLFVGNYIEVA